MDETPSSVEVGSLDGLELKDADWAAQFLGIEKNTVYRFLNDGTLPGFKLGKKWFVDESDLKRFIREQRIRQTNTRRIETWADAQVARLPQPSGVASQEEPARVYGIADGLNRLLEIADGVSEREQWSNWVSEDVASILREAQINLDVTEVDMDWAVRAASIWVGACVHCGYKPVVYSPGTATGVASETSGLCRDCRDEFLQAVYEIEPPEDPFVRRGIT